VPAVAPDAVAVGGPLVWAEGIPARGHYCFVGVLRNAQDPAPDVSAVTDSASFHNLVRLNNNVVWKNFDVDNLFAGSYARVEFHIQGWPRKQLQGELEIDLSALPGTVDGELRLVKRLLTGAELHQLTPVASTRWYTKLAISGGKRGRISNMPLQPSDNTEAILQLNLPDSIPDGAYDISLRQLVGGYEMGRITRRFAVGTFAYTGNSNSLGPSQQLRMGPQNEWKTQGRLFGRQSGDQTRLQRLPLLSTGTEHRLTTPFNQERYDDE